MDENALIILNLKKIISLNLIKVKVNLINP